MKKAIRFFKHNRKAIINSVLVGLLAVAVFDMAHNYATVDRGYVAYGGEVFIPFLIIFAPKIWAMIKESFEAVKGV